MKISPPHKRVVALIAAGYFCDVIDFSIFGALVLFIIKSGIGVAAYAALIGIATIFGIALGTVGQREQSDRFCRRCIYQFNLLLFGIFTILGALSPNVTLLVICRVIAGQLGLGAEQPLAFTYAGEYAPKRIRGRILAIVHFIGGACVWPIGTGLVLGFSAYFCCWRRSFRRLCMARRLDSDRRSRAGRVGVPVHAAGIAALSGDPRPRR